MTRRTGRFANGSRIGTSAPSASSVRRIDHEDDDSREARAVDLDPVATGRQDANAGRNAAAAGRLSLPCDALVRRDAKLPLGQSATVEAHPLQAVEPPATNQDRAAVARQHEPEDFF